MTTAEIVFAVILLAVAVWLLAHLVGQTWDREALRNPEQPVTPADWRRR